MQSWLGKQVSSLISYSLKQLVETYCWGHMTRLFCILQACTYLFFYRMRLLTIVRSWISWGNEVICVWCRNPPQKTYLWDFVELFLFQVCNDGHFYSTENISFQVIDLIFQYCHQYDSITIWKKTKARIIITFLKPYFTVSKITKLTTCRCVPTLSI